MFDYRELPHWVASRSAVAIGPRELGAILTAPASADGPSAAQHCSASGCSSVVGVVRGGAEFGPRALGHRSLLADARHERTKAQLNTLKGRAWYGPSNPRHIIHDMHATHARRYRPVAPMIAIESLDDVGLADANSPFMSFAPLITDDSVRLELRALTHLDSSARLQTVSAEDDHWLHQLLLTVQQLSGHAVLLNTSFNVKGKPILNRISDAITVLDESSGLMSHVLIDDWLFISLN